MIDYRDIFTTAKLLIDEHSAAASEVAHRRSDQLFHEGDHEGATVWRQIRAAIDDLQRRGGRLRR